MTAAQAAVHGRGTPEEQWLPHLEALALPPLALSPPPARVVVLAPHPDDEVLAVGGLLCLVDAPVEVVAVTDGEASHGRTVPGLAAARVRETDEALAALGVAARVHRLGLPDGGAAGLEAPVLAALDVGPDDWVLAPFALDGHPDHEAVARAAHRACVAAGARLLSYPVWAWHWLTPTDPRLPWASARAVALPDDVRERKRRAVEAFRTQTGPGPVDGPVLPPHVLARFARPYEVVFT